MKKAINAPLRFLWRLYKYIALVLGSIILCYLGVSFVAFTAFEEKVYWLEVPLQSGFIYHYDMKDGSKDGHHLRDQSNNVIIYSDVKRFTESGRTIYGYREDLHGNPFYFICDYGENCKNTQHLTDVELREIIQNRRLPLYTNSSGMSRSDFIQELKRIPKTTTHTDTLKPLWDYDTKYTVKQPHAH